MVCKWVATWQNSANRHASLLLRPESQSIPHKSSLWAVIGEGRENPGESGSQSRLPCRVIWMSANPWKSSPMETGWVSGESSEAWQWISGLWFLWEGQGAAHPPLWSPTNYQPHGLLSTSCPLWVLGSVLDVHQEHSGLLCHLSTGLSLNSVPLSLLFEGRVYSGDQVLGPRSPPRAPSSNQPWHSSPTPTPQAVLWQPHPLKDLPLWFGGLLTAHKGCREALSWGFLRLEHSRERISWREDGRGSPAPTAGG